MQPPSASHHPHFKRRLMTLAILLLLAAAGWGGYRLTHPRLRPVTTRVLPTGYLLKFSAGGIGYPALQSTVSAEGHAVSAMRGVMLDDRCRPISGAEIPWDLETQVSPTRKLAAWEHWKADTVMVHSWGAKSQQPGLGNCTPLALSDVGVYAVGRADTLVLPSGQRMPLPAAVQWQGGFYVSTPGIADERYLACWRGIIWEAFKVPRPVPAPDLRLYLIDTRTRRLLCAHPFFTRSPEWREEVVVFADHDRFVAVPRQGQAMVFDATRVLGRFGTKTSIWRWGEDNTAWTVDGAAPAVLHWRAGTPRLTTLPPLKADRDFHPAYTMHYGDRVWMFRHPISVPAGDYSGCAVWHDGELAATAETVSLLPASVANLLEEGRALVGIKGNLPRQGRRLTLYRHGKTVGSYQLQLSRVTVSPRVTSTLIYRASSLPPSRYAEHLAFTADGRHLAWLIDPGDGKLHLYVFVVTP